MAQRRLIINADGFGFGPGATQAIFDCICKGGLIKSVSVNANFPDAQRTAELIRLFPFVSVGVHLNPMVGRPCLPPQKIPTLVDENGFFYAKKFKHLLKNGKISVSELEMEFDAQIEKVKQLAGRNLTHLDSQANMHLEYFDLFLRLAKKWKIRRIRNNASVICLEAVLPRASRFMVYLRRPHVWAAHKYRRVQMSRARAQGIRMASNLVTVGYSGNGNKTNSRTWENIFRNLPFGTFEMYCHPAYPDETLRKWAVYCEERAREAAILSSPWPLNTARSEDVEIINFFDI